MYDYLIVGSGLSGAVFAYEMALRKKKCLVLEKRSHIGGNTFTCEIDGITVHRYGAHIFHTDLKDIWDYLSQFTEFNNFINCPMASFEGELYNLPFNMNTFSKMWGIRTPAEALAKIEAQRRELIGEPDNLEKQAISLVGRDVYEKLVKGYTEKQWGKSCHKLPPFIIKRLPVRFTFNNNYFNHRYQGIPTKGYTAIFEQLLEGCEVHLGVDFNVDQQKYRSMTRRIVYTGPIDECYNYQFGPLAYRSLRFEDESLNCPNYQGVAVMNYTDAQTPYTRIIEHKHFTFGNQKSTVITREYPQPWQSGREPYYPVNDEANQKLYASYAQLAKCDPQIIFLGRLAQYKYMDMDQTVAGSLKVARAEGR